VRLPVRRSYWQLTQGIIGPNGRVIPPTSGDEAFGIPAGYLPHACAALARRTSTVTPACREALNGFRGFITYQPAGRYWAFQGIETAIFALLAAILLTVTALVLLRRDA
jgi:hypothetical protein